MLFAVTFTTFGVTFRATSAFCIFGVVVLAGPGVLLGTRAIVTPGEADLRFPIFSFAITFGFLEWHVGEMVLQCLFAILGVVLPAHEIVYQFPEAFVTAYWIGFESVVPEQVLDIEFVCLWKVHIKLQHEKVHEVVVRWSTRHAGDNFVPFKHKLLNVPVGQRDLVETSCVRHVFVLRIHSEELVDHEQNLSACNISFHFCALFSFRLFDLLPEKVSISRNAPHQCLQEQGVEPHETA